MSSEVFAVVAGGGTAGHVLPALAVAEGLVSLGHDPGEIHYVGARRGVEMQLLPPSGFAYTLFEVVGLRRALSIAALKHNVGFVTKMFAARHAAIRLLAELKPSVVVSVGGYASLPAVLAARRLDIPVVVVSYDKRPGRASRLAAGRAAACAVAFPDSPLPHAVYTGAPLRRAIVEVDRIRDREAARRQLGIPDDRFLLVVMGGSLGSGVLNEAVSGYIESHADRRDLAVRHLCGERFQNSMGPSRDGSTGLRYDVVGFEPNMPTLYAAADLLVGRGGASTVCEVAAVGLPSILVPWAGAADDHQTDNVRWLSDQGGAVLVSEAQLTPARFALEVDRLISNTTARTVLAAAAREAGTKHRSRSLARLVEAVGRG
jgi:UDP-N-acetylglucosamine--N-acetylmuramyl-(pentapeptide) pyrophosphoryl-undecaprenol N-acetylglucosamine transferase